MNRLDRHIALVRGKLMLRRFFSAVAFTSMIFFAAVGLAIVLDHLLQVHPPHVAVIFWAGAALAILLALIHSFIHKPTAHEAAVAIDDKLGLKEKFSTALFMRHNSDAFAAAAVQDAEQAAENVSLHKRFPLSFPRMGYYSIAVAGLTMLATLLPNVDLFGREAHRKQLSLQEQKRTEARHVVEQALATVSSYPKSLQTNETIQTAQKDLQNLLKQPINDPAQARRTAFKAREDALEAIKEQIRKNQRYATAQMNKQLFQTLTPASQAQGPVADAQRELAKGNFDEASKQIGQAAEKFNQMSEAQKQQSARQMQQLARQLQEMAQNTAPAQQLQQRLQQMGANAQQAQQITQTMQQAAQGNQSAQQQLQQLQKQLSQQMNAGNGATQQQQMAMQQMMNRGLATAHALANARQMGQAAQQMSQAMQQQSTNQQGQQTMTQAQQSMQQAMSQMGAMQHDAQQLTAAQNATQQALNNASKQPNKSGNGKPTQGAPGQNMPGNPTAQSNGQAGSEAGVGGVGSKTQAPYSIQQEMDPSQNNVEDGRILASSFVNAGAVKNKSTLHLSQVAKSAIQDSTDEVDEEAVTKESQQVVKKYFSAMESEQQPVAK